jgi:hypothetical protein
MPSIYARLTTVTTDRSQLELSTILKRYGANQIAFGWQTLPDGSEQALIGFVMKNRQARISLNFPNSSECSKTATGRERHGNIIVKEWNKQTRQRWRVLLLMVKAQLEAIELGIVRFDDVFAGFTVLEGGKTVGQLISAGLDKLYSTGLVQSMLPEGEEK